jgi:hypothetical protein
MQAKVCIQIKGGAAKLEPHRLAPQPKIVEGRQPLHLPQTGTSTQKGELCQGGYPFGSIASPKDQHQNVHIAFIESKANNARSFGLRVINAITASSTLALV